MICDTITVSGVNEGHYTPSKPLSDGVYYWWVRAQFSDGEQSDWSERGQFTVKTTPRLFSPAHSATWDTTNLIRLVWYAVTDEAEDTKYCVQLIWTRQDFPSPPEERCTPDSMISVSENNGNLRRYTYTLPDLPAGQYSWHVRVLYTDDLSVGRNEYWSDLHNFTIR
ncbi:MAG: hypothetical protein H6672_10710 [Anaerolineaceae bacterium]|nr:hypothetical protein [Anaerolineaceae bacterium]